MPGLKRSKNVLDYLIDLNRKQPIEKMSRAEIAQLLKAMGWQNGEDYDQARRKLLRLLGFFIKER